MKASGRVIMAVLTVLAVPAVAGCGSGGGTAGGAAATGSVPSTTVTPGQIGASGSGPSSAGAGPSGQGAPGASGQATVPRCHTVDLTGHVEGGGAAAGQRYAILALTNRTGTTCRIYGYPGLELVDSHGGTMRTDVRRDTTVAPALVTLVPGRTAWAQLHWGAVPADDEAATNCAPDPAELRVIPPDETTQLTMSFGYGPVCQHGQISVSAFALNRPGGG